MYLMSFLAKSWTDVKTPRAMTSRSIFVFTRRFQVNLSTKCSITFSIVLSGFAGPNLGTTEAMVMQFGDWSTPVNVGAPLNTAFNDGYAVFTRDMLTVYFTSDRPGGKGGDDLWTAHRETVDSPWDAPVNLDRLLEGDL